MTLTAEIAEWIYVQAGRTGWSRQLVNRLLLRLIPEVATVGKAELILNPCDPVVSSAIALGIYEVEEVLFFRQVIGTSKVFVDVGANIGLYTTLAVHAMPTDAMIIALEPHHRSFELLQSNVNRNRVLRGSDAPRVVLIPKAATARAGNYELRLNPDNSGDNRLYRGTFQGRLENWPTEHVSGVTLDEVCEELSIEQVDFVKLDVQGYEHHVIQGAKMTLSRSQQVVLMTEFWPKGLVEAGSHPHEYLKLLRTLGFVIYEMRSKLKGKLEITHVRDDDALIHKLPGRKYANLVAVKSAAKLEQIRQATHCRTSP
ncbi:MAG: FkbM family methyltransferase [Thermoflexales bacterium]|nr:FkbM family methyltransferase [Thermoflexales bacterium]